MRVSGKGTERIKIMRNNNWKMKVVIAIAFIIGAACGIAAAIFVPATYDSYRGLISFGTIIVVSAVIVLIAVRVFHIGEE